MSIATTMRRPSVLCVLAVGIWLGDSPAHAQYQTRSLTCESPDVCKRECDAGQAMSCTSLANMYHGGLLVRADIGEAADLYGKACKLDDPWACLERSEMALRGWTFEVERSSRLITTVHSPLS